jgi:hypothetical protein
MPTTDYMYIYSSGKNYAETNSHNLELVQIGRGFTEIPQCISNEQHCTRLQEKLLASRNHPRFFFLKNGKISHRPERKSVNKI